ncbi:broad specificity phosphatase PhoE [Microbacteriaceae bacterium SG_E_30_P1]|uniref:Broad specificity phosphatase PhoE n=1 Tax=Antiquaquibacter oligotrophicus TaxID=2880260 RepID=A0ABT6KPW9_9MICO|nr:histidine phosphatase family protein [Antiquaquibacter oligotrophicus]MDH6182028.1 broad specificity phosphatase PhoE [Antiquaquibacter oligotrophicus]UDF12304.1 histidine phosphatase family protein [Antiquaquibacter oligotrophicus]
MPADLIHLVRHGEVHNPERILYGRIAGYHLSTLGHEMAAVAATSFEGRDIRRLIASPLQRTQESAKPWADLFELPIETDERIIEPHNWFEGTRMRERLRNPISWPRLINPMRPSWGESYRSVLTRMFSAIDDAWAETVSGEVVLVSHQMPIVTVARNVAGRVPFHDPRKRRCTLSSITTLQREGDRFVEVDYREPARELLENSIDLGAV